MKPLLFQDPAWNKVSSKREDRSVILNWEEQFFSNYMYIKDSRMFHWGIGLPALFYFPPSYNHYYNESVSDAFENGESGEKDSEPLLQ